MGRVCQDPGKEFEATLRSVCPKKGSAHLRIMKGFWVENELRGERVDELLENIDHNPEGERILMNMFEGCT